MADPAAIRCQRCERWIGPDEDERNMGLCDSCWIDTTSGIDALVRKLIELYTPRRIALELRDYYNAAAVVAKDKQETGGAAIARRAEQAFQKALDDLGGKRPTAFSSGESPL